MKPKCKAWISLVCALAMLVSLLPTTALATDGDGSTSGSASSVTIDKTATDLDENLETTVTLSVGAAEEHKDAYVVFVLDKSTSADVRAAACDMLSELMNQVNAGYTVNVSVVGFESSVQTMLDWTALTQENYSAISEALNSKLSESGTNIYLGLTQGKAMLDAVNVDASYKHLVLVTDGITYLWGQNGAPYSIYSESISNGEESINAGNDMMRLHHPDDFDAFVAEFADMNAWMQKYGSAIASDVETYQHPYVGGQIRADQSGLMQDSTYLNAGFEEDDYVPGEVLAEHYSANEAAVYMAATAWQSVVAAGYNAYAYADATGSNAANAVTYPWATNFVSSLGTLGGTSARVSDDTIAGMFDNVKSAILYEIASGTITDVIGSEFSLVGLDTFRLTVGGTELQGTVNGSSVNFGDAADGIYPYTVNFDAQTNSFTFQINRAVETANPLQLSYVLCLTNPSTDGAVKDTQTADTNESATLTYTSTDGTSGTATFPVPTLPYYLASIQPADMTIYMGGSNGYEGVSGSNGSISGSNSLPEPGYYITLPDAVNQALAEAGLSGSESEPADLSNLIKIRTKDSDPNHYWTLSPYGNSYSAAYGKYIYAVVQGDDSAPFRLTFTDVNDPSNTFDSDSFTPATEGALNQEYTMNIYQELINSKELLIEVSIPDHGSYYCIATTQPGTLDIRYVTSDQDSVVTPAYDSVEEASAADDPNKTALDNAYMVRGENTKFFINDSSVDVTESEDFAQVSLLFDDVVTTSTTDGMSDYATLLRDQAIAQVAQSFENVQYQAKYLDLVDANNGNVWLTPSEDVTVYWPYPEGTDANTTFYLVHFENLDRDMSNEEIASAIENASKEAITVTTDAYGISFQTDSFSPYVLLWDAKTTPAPTADPGTPVTPTATPAPTAGPVGTPATGDAAPVVLFGGAAVLAALSLTVLVVLRKRRGNC